jgi:hypothetical protein
MDEGRKRVLGIMAAILANLHMQTADDLFGGPQGRGEPAKHSLSYQHLELLRADEHNVAFAILLLKAHVYRENVVLSLILS